MSVLNLLCAILEQVWQSLFVDYDTDIERARQRR